MTLAERLLPELEQQLDNTRRVLNAVPDAETTLHRTKDRCLRLAWLAHTAELAGFATLHLTVPASTWAHRGPAQNPAHDFKKQISLRSLRVWLRGLSGRSNVPPTTSSTSPSPS